MTPQVKSVKTIVSKTDLKVGEEVTIKTVSDKNADLTSKSEVYINGKAIKGNKFKAEKEGVYLVHVKYKDLTSKIVKITVKKAVDKSIRVTVSTTNLKIGGVVLIKVLSEKKVDLTSKSKIYINGKAIKGNVFKGEKDGVYKVTAKYENLTSKIVKITVEKAADKSIRVTVSKTNLKIGEEVTIKVLSDENVDLTSEAKIFINGKEIIGAKFKAEKEGAYKVTATYKKSIAKGVKIFVKK